MTNSRRSTGAASGRFSRLGIVLAVVFVVAAWALWWLWAAKSANAGTAGDSFGSLTSLFTGLAFAFLVWQIVLQRQDLKLQRDDLATQRELLKQQVEDLELQRKATEQLAEHAAADARAQQARRMLDAYADFYSAANALNTALEAVCKSTFGDTRIAPFTHQHELGGDYMRAAKAIEMLDPHHRVPPLDLRHLTPNMREAWWIGVEDACGAAQRRFGGWIPTPTDD